MFKQKVIYAGYNSFPNNNQIFNYSQKKPKCDSMCSGKGRKHLGKRRKCCLPAFFPFPKMFSKGFFLRAVKNHHCIVQNYGLTLHQTTKFQPNSADDKLDVVKIMISL